MFRGFSDKGKTDKWSTPSWKRCINDTLLWSKDLEMLFMQVMKYLSFCGEKGIVFNPKKLRLLEKEMEIFGLKLDQQGVKPADNQVESLQKYSTPKSLRDM